MSTSYGSLSNTIEDGIDNFSNDEHSRCCICQLLCCCCAHSKKNSEENPLLDSAAYKKHGKASGLGHTYPKENSGCCSQVFFSWLTPLMALGNIRPLEFDDLYELNPENRASVVSGKFERKWSIQKQKKNPSIMWALAYAFGGPFLWAGVLKLFHDSLIFVGPMVIKSVIAFLNNPNAPMEEGYFYAAAMFVSGVIQSFCLRQYFYYCYETGMRFRSAVVTAVYQKSLVLSSSARQRATTGEITNLMSIDAQRLQDLTPYLHGIWYGIFQIVISSYLLWQQIGVSCLGGIAVIIFTIPLTALIARIMRNLQQKLMRVKDERIKVCHEVLSGMKVIKLQAWENSFLKKVMEYRSDELAKLQTYLYARAASGTVFNTVPALVAVSSFVMYVLLGHKLEVGTALTSLALFNILRFPLFMLPQVINNIVEASVSFNRLTKFLLEEELVKVGSGSLTHIGVKVENADFCWNSDVTSNQTDKSEKDAKNTNAVSSITSISLDAKNGQLIAIIGHVGSGKSTLLSGILGDARCSRGTVNLRGSVAYVSQQPFIQNATLHDNILFGKPYDEDLYRLAIQVSALTPDLQVLPAGDMTEIGEKGINLSGGQRTRVSIARAVYQDADIYLFDDPLSAVDSHVGKIIFNSCIVGALENKLRLFVTNGITFLPQCDQVLVLQKGKIEESGEYNKLVQTNGILTSLVKSNDQSGVNSNNESVTSEEENDAKSFHESYEVVERTSNVTDTQEKPSTESLMTAEDRSTGDVKFSVYLQWMRAAGGYSMIVVIIFSYLFAESLTLGSTIWLSYWSEHTRGSSETSQMFYLYVYTGLNLGYAVATYSRILILLSCGLLASKRLFSWLFERVLRAPMTFFDTTPLGRIVNRMSKDIYTIDEQIPGSWNMYLGCVISVLSTIATICYVTPYFAFVLIPIIYGYYTSQRYFIKTSRELQRLDSMSRSPVLALLTETLDGLPTIHAYHAESRFADRNRLLLDKNQRAYFLNFAANCWLALRLEFAGTLVATSAALFAVLARGNANPLFAGLAGVSLSYAFNVTQTLNWSVRMVSQLQTQMVSVERVKAYAEMKTEASLTSFNCPSASWPEKGDILFTSVNLRYRPGLPRVLRGLTLSIRSQEKIGIVGRTGAGKSSIIAALMRLVELDSGSISIDDVDISKIGLHELRSKISIIPQDPVLFSGTVRNNLDPFDNYSDHEIWQSVRRARLESAVAALDAPVSERGANFSVGERQLLCIARALLRKSKIILMDEATASIDVQTDQMIQHSIRDEFANCTCLTIAHRLNTIMDSDRVLVMDAGKAAEFDTPKKLLNVKDGIFSSLVKHWKRGEHDHS